MRGRKKGTTGLSEIYRREGQESPGLVGRKNEQRQKPNEEFVFLFFPYETKATYFTLFCRTDRSLKGVHYVTSDACNTRQFLWPLTDGTIR
jgi:hypothetical protein